MWTILSGRTKEALLDQLNGAITGKQNLAQGLDLNGLTLEITAPVVVTVTFTDPNPVTPAQIIAEIEAANAALVGAPSLQTVQSGTTVGGRFPQVDRRLQLVDPAGATITVDSGASTGAALLGFDTSNESGSLIPQTRVQGGVSQDVSGHYFVLVSP